MTWTRRLWEKSGSENAFLSKFPVFSVNTPLSSCQAAQQRCHRHQRHFCWLYNNQSPSSQRKYSEGPSRWYTSFSTAVKWAMKQNKMNSIGWGIWLLTANLYLKTLLHRLMQINEQIKPDVSESTALKKYFLSGFLNMTFTEENESNHELKPLRHFNAKNWHSWTFRDGIYCMFSEHLKFFRVTQKISPISPDSLEEKWFCTEYSCSFGIGS